jgi:hypothetical protein
MKIAAPPSLSAVPPMLQGLPLVFEETVMGTPGRPSFSSRRRSTKAQRGPHNGSANTLQQQKTQRENYRHGQKLQGDCYSVGDLNYPATWTHMIQQQ